MFVRMGFWMAVVLAGGACGAAADPLPYPSADFAMKATLKDGGSLDIAYTDGRMRLEILPKSSPALIVGIVDLKTAKVALMMPSMPKMAVQADMPPSFSFAALTGSGTKMGSDTVAGEACDLWKIDAIPNQAAAGPTTACITADGIALRTTTEIQGKPQVIYQATSLTRGPQDPRQFMVPPGVQTMKLPKSAAGALPGLNLLAAPAAGQ